MVINKIAKRTASSSPTHKISAGFTLMEILVATTIFALVVTAMLSLFNYTLKINRSTEAIRQATQGMRNFIEFVVKEVRNGKVYYGVVNGQSAGTTVGPCSTPTISSGNPPPIGDTYAAQDNKFAIQTTEGDIECFYMGYGSGNSGNFSVGSYVGGGVFSSSAATNPKPVLVVQKNSLPLEILTPPNVSIQNLYFMVRPVCDPYAANCSSYSSGSAKIQPFVTVVAKFLVTLPTGEKTTIYYQTTVSTNQYDLQ